MTPALSGDQGRGYLEILADNIETHTTQMLTQTAPDLGTLLTYVSNAMTTIAEWSRSGDLQVRALRGVGVEASAALSDLERQIGRYREQIDKATRQIDVDRMHFGLRDASEKTAKKLYEFTDSIRELPI